MPLTRGKRLGRYEVQSQLGVGGVGEVYLACDAELYRIRALKILRSAVAFDTQYMRRFIQEERSGPVEYLSDGIAEV